MGVVTGSSSLRPSFLSLSRVVQPDTILLWHRAGFRAYSNEEIRQAFFA